MMRPAELVVRGARLWPARADGADTVACGGSRVLAVGRASDLAPLRGPHTVDLDARDATVTPGITDAHIHLVQWARSLGELALDAGWDRARVLETLRRFSLARPDERVLIGRGWAAEGWVDAPDLAALDAVSDGRPVLLHSKDFHALWVNRAAFERAGVTDATPDPDGGRFERDARGRLTGVVREHAVRAFRSLMPEPDAARERELLSLAARTLHTAGITMVHDFEGPDESRRLQDALTRDPAFPRVLMHLAHASLDDVIATGLASGVGDDRFRVGAVKLFADGTLGSRTAAMLEPYAGTTSTGMALLAPADLRALVQRAIAARISVAIHAIGDRAVRSSLDAFESVPQSARARLALMPRIEHAQLVHLDDLPRFGRLSVAASMQPAHQVSDMPIARRAWADRLEFAYPWESLLERGALLAFGSDAPVERPSVVLGLHAAIARRAVGDRDDSAMSPRQRVSLDAALRAYTSGPARLAGMSAGAGTLEPGSLADLVIWDRDLFAAAPDALAGARPLATVLGGRVVWSVEAGGEIAPAIVPGGQQAVA